ncbi:helix-turn-helix domain-containing protein [Nocardia sp. R6R-6]|uniref:helix-turn-helix domain-containing protein n=1 Tax=Nocardia sp. R6R-6 TaxID=3459303 RepID=UPI00403E1940
MTTASDEPKASGKRSPIVHHGTLGAGGDRGNLYTSLPHALARDARLTATARSVALYIWSHVTGWQTSAEAVAEDLGTTAKTVRAALANLQDHGWIVRQPYARPRRKPFRETWHLQLSNTPFTPEEIERYSRTVIVDGDGTPVETTEGLDTLGRNDRGRSVETTEGGSVKTTDQSSESLVVNSPEVNSISNGLEKSTQEEPGGSIWDKPPTERLRIHNPTGTNRSYDGENVGDLDRSPEVGIIPTEERSAPGVDTSEFPEDARHLYQAITSASGSWISRSKAPLQELTEFAGLPTAMRTSDASKWLSANRWIEVRQANGVVEIRAVKTPQIQR